MGGGTFLLESIFEVLKVYVYSVLFLFLSGDGMYTVAA